MMKPLDVIDSLKTRYANTDIDWELILEHGYRCWLSSESVVLDIGGHAGRHSRVFADEIGCARVEVVEPLPGQAAYLHALHDGNPRVRVHEVALGAQRGWSSFVFNQGAPEESGLRARVYNDPSAASLEEIEVEVSTIDSLFADLERLDFVKIDTEGGEVDILVGGEKTIRRLRPVLSVEYGAASYEAYGKERITLYRLMEDFEYILFDLFGNSLATPEDWDECVDNYYWDYFAVPRKRATEFRMQLRGQIDRVDACIHGSQSR